MKKLLKDPIPLATAAQYAKNWRDFNSANKVNEYNLDELLPKAFTFHESDFSELKRTGAVTLRVYFGYIDVNVTPGPTPIVDKPMKIMIVGVDSDGKDIINTSMIGDSGIYDFAIPCPPTCDITSPLYNDPA